MSSDDSKKLTIMLIEDNDDDALMVRQMFEDNPDIEILWAPAIHEAHDLGRCDIVLLDLMLGPTENSKATMGVESVRVCREGFRHKPIIVLTHVDDVDTQARCMAAGANWYFNKNKFNAADLLRAMQVAIRVQATMEMNAEEKTAIKLYLVDAQAAINKTATMLGNMRNRLEQIDKDDDAITGKD